MNPCIGTCTLPFFANPAPTLGTLPFAHLQRVGYRAKLDRSPHTTPTPVISTEAQRRVETPVLALAVALRWHHQKSRHPERSERTTVLVLAFAFLSVIPEGNLLPHLLSANGAATSQPRAKPWGQDHHKSKGLNARHKSPGSWP